MGCVVVGSDTAPVREVIQDGETGFLVPFFDPDALADKVAEIASAPDRYAAVGRQARAQVLERYAFETASLPRYLDLIRTFAGGG